MDKQLLKVFFKKDATAVVFIFSFHTVNDNYCMC